ncbi:hypothetical protein [Calothrix sp. 336/3]|uniref:hypothetical protein n=1 Tax=Calothrix sp. 336/3 TaxID=1337936 RepID=UPI0004E41CFE|nr:hypothetical protein [Calothrix sp. 336/3]AKG21862.1 hypothetical protein IJ00_11855 [Calothrix sp. 336/3]
MQPQVRNKSLFNWILLFFSSASWCYAEADASWAANTSIRNIPDELTSKIASSCVSSNTNGYNNPQKTVFPTIQPLQQQQLAAFQIPQKNFKSFSQFSCNHLAVTTDTSKESVRKVIFWQNSENETDFQSSIISQAPPQNPPPQNPPPQNPPAQNPPPQNPPPQNPPPPPNEPPSLNSQPNDLPATPSDTIQKKLEQPTDERIQRIEKLRQALQKKKKPTEETVTEQEELGTLVLREVPPTLEEPQPPPIITPRRQFKPVGYLQARSGYFQTSNIFSDKKFPLTDGLYYYGLSFGSVPIALSSKTYLSGSVDGNIINYLDQSKFNYHQVRFNVSLYHQLTPRMYGELGWSNQQLFYAKDGKFFNAGDRFLNENSWRVSLGRRDPLSERLMLDSFYEFRWSLTNPPEKRNRAIHSLWVSLSYYLQQSLQVGVDYQFGLSDFTQREREDQYHRFYGHLSYGLSDYSSIYLQAGVSVGDSTDPQISFDGWFFSINYNMEIGQF